MPTDLVTGATGLLGANLVRALLDRGRAVRVLVRPTSNVQHLADLRSLEYAHGDVTQADSVRAACAGIDVLYHCAATVSMWPQRAAEMRAVNVEGTEHVLAAARATGVRRLVYSSSINAIGIPRGPHDPPSREDAPWNLDTAGVDNPYGRTKVAAQRRVVAATDVDAVVVNPAFMFGPYDARPSSGRMILEVAAGRAFFFPRGGANFVHVGDVVAGMIAAADRGRRGESYLLGAHNVTYREVFSTIAEVVGRRPPWLPLPWSVARVAGWFGDAVGRVSGREPAINTTTVRLGFAWHYVDSGKAIAELGLPQTPLRVAVEDAVRWFRNVGMLGPPRKYGHSGSE